MQKLSSFLHYLCKNCQVCIFIPLYYYHRQSHSIEVVQGGVSNTAIHNWFWIFSLFFVKEKSKKNQKIFMDYVRDGKIQGQCSF